MTITTFQMLFSKIGPLVVRLCRPIAQSHMIILVRMEAFIQQMDFHLPLNSFLHKTKTTSIRDFIFSKFGISITRFWCDTSKLALKQGDGNIATDICAY